MSEFDNIIGLEAWSAKLRSLLDEAQGIARHGALDERIGMSRRLTEFIVRSHPNTPEIKGLDSAAQATARALLMESMEGRLKEIAERTGEYRRLTKEVRSQAKENEKAARSIRYEGLIETLHSATELIERMKRLKGALEKGDTGVAKLIDQALAAVKRLHARIGELV